MPNPYNNKSELLSNLPNFLQCFVIWCSKTLKPKKYKAPNEIHSQYSKSRVYVIFWDHEYFMILWKFPTNIGNFHKIRMEISYFFFTFVSCYLGTFFNKFVDVPLFWPMFWLLSYFLSLFAPF